MNTIIVNLISYAKDGVSKGCLMAMADEEVASCCGKFCKDNISSENLAEDGVEKESHVTVLYGFDEKFDTASLETHLTDKKPLNVELGAVSRFESAEYDVIKAEVNCPELHELHHSIRKNFADSVEITHPIYHPHMTLAYVKKGAHPELDGNEELKGKKFTVSSLMYSPPDKEGRKNLKLKG